MTYTTEDYLRLELKGWRNPATKCTVSESHSLVSSFCFVSLTFGYIWHKNKLFSSKLDPFLLLPSRFLGFATCTQHVIVTSVSLQHSGRALSTGSDLIISKNGAPIHIYDLGSSTSLHGWYAMIWQLSKTVCCWFDCKTLFVSRSVDLRAWCSVQRYRTIGLSHFFQVWRDGT